jgi:hypothetical protein
MPIATVTLIVPASGDGPIANVSSLASSKTVLLAGAFAGAYIIMASHDGANFVPILQFDAGSGGGEGIRLSCSGAFVAMRVRAATGAVPASPIVCEVSAEAVLGTCGFATVATLAPGATGPTAAIDLDAAFPPTGLDTGLNFICAGSFRGPIAVEGSMDGVRFNPIGQFRAGSPGPAGRLEFSPLRTSDKIRYVRLNVGAVILDQTIVTLGGVQSAVSSNSENVINGSGTTLLKGEIVRVVGNLTVNRAFADAPSHAAGVVGAMGEAVAAGATGRVVNTGAAFVLLEAGLTPVAGTALWLSDVTAGRATNLAPAIPVYLGVIKDASLYAATGGVLADLTPSFVLSSFATLRQTYAFGASATDQTISLLDVKGGGVVIDGSGGGFTGTYGLQVKSTGSGVVNFGRTGGLEVAKDQNATTLLDVANVTNGTSARAMVQAAANGGSLDMQALGPGYTDVPSRANSAVLDTNYPNLLLSASAGAGTIKLITGSTTGVRMTVTPTGNVLVGTVTDVASSILRVDGSKSVAAATGAIWNGVDVMGATLTLTGTPAVVTELAEKRVGAAVINGPGNTVSDAYDELIDAAPAGSATITRSWSLGAKGAIQARAGLVLGAGLAPPTEPDLVLGAGATAISVSNSGRIGYVAGSTQQLMASLNGGYYVPVLMGPTATGFAVGAVPFGITSGQLGEDSASLFWNNSTKQLGVGTAAPTNSVTAYYPTAVPAGAAICIGSTSSGFAGTNDNGTGHSLVFDEVGYRSGFFVQHAGQIGIRKEKSWNEDSAGVGIQSSLVFLTQSGSSGAPVLAERACITSLGNLVIGATAAGTNAAKCLALSNTATAPSSSVDLCHLYCADNGAGHATLGIYAEETVQAIGGKTANEVFPMLINNVVKYFVLAA